MQREVLSGGTGAQLIPRSSRLKLCHCPAVTMDPFTRSIYSTHTLGKPLSLTNTHTHTQTAALPVMRGANININRHNRIHKSSEDDHTPIKLLPIISHTHQPDRAPASCRFTCTDKTSRIYEDPCRKGVEGKHTPTHTPTHPSHPPVRVTKVGLKCFSCLPK